MSVKIKFFRVFAAFWGLTAVILGAMGAHMLKQSLAPSQMDAFQTAVQYQMYLALALLWLSHSPAFYFKVALLWTLGSICFSGSIYALVLLHWKFLAPITPIGGSLIIIGWAILLYHKLQE